MGRAIAVRTHQTADELRHRAKRLQQRAPALRLMAIAAVLDGASRKDAAKASLMTERALYDWILRFNAEGVDGLIDKPRSGRPPKLDEAQRAQVLQWVREGPDRERLGIVRWRLRDLCAEIERCFNITIGEDAVGRLLKRSGFSHVSARPQHPKQDPEIMDAFKKTWLHAWPRCRPSSRIGL